MRTALPPPSRSSATFGSDSTLHHVGRSRYGKEGKDGKDHVLRRGGCRDHLGSSFIAGSVDYTPNAQRRKGGRVNLIGA